MDINMEQMTDERSGSGGTDQEPVSQSAYRAGNGIYDYALEGYKVKARRFLVKDDLPITISECMDTLVGEIEQKAQNMEFPFV